MSQLFLYLSLSLYLCLYLSLYLNFRPNLDSWHHGLLENIWFEGSLRSDGSVRAYLWTQEKLLRVDGTGEIIGSTTGPRGPENHPVYSYYCWKGAHHTTGPTHFMKQASLISPHHLEPLNKFWWRKNSFYVQRTSKMKEKTDNYVCSDHHLAHGLFWQANFFGPNFVLRRKPNQSDTTIWFW